jgi:hypothetical protein
MHPKMQIIFLSKYLARGWMPWNCWVHPYLLGLEIMMDRIYTARLKIAEISIFSVLIRSVLKNVSKMSFLINLKVFCDRWSISQPKKITKSVRIFTRFFYEFKCDNNFLVCILFKVNSNYFLR